MTPEEQLREKLRKIEALFAGAATAGERMAAGAAAERIRERLKQTASTEKEIEVSVLGNELKLSASHEAEKKEESRKYHRRERTAGKVERILRFPLDIDDSKIDASFKNGVLSIALPKAQAALPRKIEVKG